MMEHNQNPHLNDKNLFISIPPVKYISLSILAFTDYSTTPRNAQDKLLLNTKT